MGREFSFTMQGAELIFFLRLLLAALAGGVIGWNRARAGKPAGVGTHALVAVGAALFVAIPIVAESAHGLDAVTRVIQGIAAGIGFLGAGEIFRDAGGVHGLTSAAALWGTAAVGVVAGCGSLLLLVASTAIVLLILVVSPRCESQLLGRPH
ncbi:MAG TPA: MgtC/SapB family protein [Candidatus Sulfotelmatobacter sp.]|nr:MgtC/SapB family protein [Candidatus Sulfotelmatobacter sp.]